jgi:hypothetical protein
MLKEEEGVPTVGEEPAATEGTIDMAADGWRLGFKVGFCREEIAALIPCKMEK